MRICKDDCWRWKQSIGECFDLDPFASPQYPCLDRFLLEAPNLRWTNRKIKSADATFFSHFRSWNACTANFKCLTSNLPLRWDGRHWYCCRRSSSDAPFRTNDHVQNTSVKTFTGICTQIDGKFRDDFLLPLLSFITVQATQPSPNDSDPSKRSELVSNLFDLYNALSRCSNSQSSIFNHLLPGLYCLRGDLAQYRPERLAQLDSIVQELENQLTQHFSSNESNNAQSDSKRGRVLKSLDHLRDSTGKLTYRWMKKK